MKSFLRNKGFVYKIYSHIKNIVISKRGFTLIESFIALLAQCLIMMLMPIFIMTFSQLKHTLFDDRTYDLEMMIKDISDHLNRTDIKDVLILKKGIEIQNKQSKITYYLQNQKIIKTVNHRGNITLCNEVMNVVFTKVSNKYILMHIKYRERNGFHEKEILF